MQDIQAGASGDQELASESFAPFIEMHFSTGAKRFCGGHEPGRA
jgi:hypothetical protein